MRYLILNSQKIAILDEPRMIVAMDPVAIDQKKEELIHKIRELKQEGYPASSPEIKDLQERVQRLITIKEFAQKAPYLSVSHPYTQEQLKKLEKEDIPGQLGFRSPDSVLELIDRIREKLPEDRQDVEKELVDISRRIWLIKEELDQSFSDLKDKYNPILEELYQRLQPWYNEFLYEDVEEIELPPM